MINDAEGIRRRIVTKRARCTGGSATPAGFIGVNAIRHLSGETQPNQIAHITLNTIQIKYSVNPVIEVHILIGRFRRCGHDNRLFGFWPILIHAALISHDFPHAPGDLRYVVSHIVRHVLIIPVDRRRRWLFH
jgi:hypothetical protein